MKKVQNHDHFAVLKGLEKNIQILDPFTIKRLSKLTISIRPKHQLASLLAFLGTLSSDLKSTFKKPVIIVKIV